MSLPRSPPRPSSRWCSWRAPRPGRRPRVRGVGRGGRGVARRVVPSVIPVASSGRGSREARPRATRRAAALVVHGAGDVNLDPDYIPALRSNGCEHAWSGLDGLFAADDLTVVNLECPVSDRRGDRAQGVQLPLRSRGLPAARAAGVEVANLANNHAATSACRPCSTRWSTPGRPGSPRSVSAPNSSAATAPAIIERGGWRIAVLGFGGVVPAANWLAGPNRPGMANGDDIESMTAAIRAAGAGRPGVRDHPLGHRVGHPAAPEDVARARAMIDAGADGIFGHHAHRLQPMDCYRGRPIAWGLGNFVWPTLSEAGSRTAVAQFVVEPRRLGDRLPAAGPRSPRPGIPS